MKFGFLYHCNLFTYQDSYYPVEHTRSHLCHHLLVNKMWSKLVEKQKQYATHKIHLHRFTTKVPDGLFFSVFWLTPTLFDGAYLINSLRNVIQVCCERAVSALYNKPNHYKKLKKWYFFKILGDCALLNLKGDWAVKNKKKCVLSCVWVQCHFCVQYT